MERAEAELLIWKVLDGEATSREEQALNDAAIQDSTVQELVDHARRQHRGLDHLATLYRDSRLEESTVRTALTNVAARARAEAQALQSLEPKDISEPPEFSSLLGRLFRPLPNFAGAMVGAVAALVAVFLVSDPRQDSVTTQDLQVILGLDLSPTPGNDSGFGPTRGDEPEAVALTSALEKVKEILSSPSPDYAQVVAIQDAFQKTYPAALAECYCEVAQFQKVKAFVAERSGRYAEAGSAMVAAGECLKLNPCSAAD